MFWKKKDEQTGADDERQEVTVELIEQYLERFGWEQYMAVPEPKEKEGVVLTGWAGLGDEGHRLAIDPIVEKGMLLFKAHRVLEAPPDETPADRLNGLLLVLGALNYKHVMGGFAYDPRDGEVAFKLGMPVYSDDLEYEDFEHCLKAVIAAVEVDGPKLKAIVDGTKTPPEILSAEGMAGEEEETPEA